MNICTVTTLFPNHNEPKLGIFIKTRLEFLKTHYPDINITVIAPVPWFPFKSKWFGQYAKFAGVKPIETISGITVFHPKYLVIPKVGMYLTPYFLARAVRKSLSSMLKRHKKIDLIDGHYFYPDGVAIERVASKLKIPFTCTARGTDINLIPQHKLALKQLRPVFANSAHMMSVCQALKDEMVSLGAPEEKVTVLRNGVNLNLFSASNADEQQTRKAKLGIEPRINLVLSVGWLVERKGHHLVIDAIKGIDNTKLVIIGDGPYRQALEKQIHELHLNERIDIIDGMPQKELNDWFKAADCTVLASSREGWANILLESLASGTPVIATKVWGTPEVVQTTRVGRLVERNIQSIANGIQEVINANLNRSEVRRYAEQFDWQATSDGQIKIFSNIVSEHCKK